MRRFLPKNLLSSVLTLILFGGVSTIGFTSCFHNPEEPEMVTPDDNNSSETEEPKDDPSESEEPKEDDPKVDETPSNDSLVPADFTFPLAYVHLPEELPSQFKDYTGFTVSFNKDNHTPNYVAWELLASETTGSANRNNYDFMVDNSIVGCPTKDYAYSTTGYQRGHMCPAADQKWSEKAMHDCMYMTNICPQYASLNEKIWVTLENNSRQWAKRDGAIWIIAGPVYAEDDQQRIGQSQVRVPGAYFKAFLYNDEKNPRAIAFVFANTSNPGNLEDYAMSIDDLEELLGYDFFPALPDEVEEVVEATYNYADWIK